MNHVIVFSNNFVINDLSRIKDRFMNPERLLFITPQMLLANERLMIKSIFPESECWFAEYAAFISDSEAERCDQYAFAETSSSLGEFFGIACYKKNEIIADRILAKYIGYACYVLSDDLGVDARALENKGFIRIEGETYFKETKKKKPVSDNNRAVIPVHVSEYESRVFAIIGNLGRVKDRITDVFEYSEEETQRYNRGEFNSEYIYIVPVHELGKCLIPRDSQYNVNILVDGFIPLNFTGKDFLYKEYSLPLYCLDNLQREGLKHSYGREAALFPFHKSIYLPEIDNDITIRRVLVSANCAGPWSSLINLSDTDYLLELTHELAERFTDIDFVFRPHPLADSPMHEGIHSIERIQNYIEYVNLPNFNLSLNIGKLSTDRKFISVQNGTLAEEIENADLVISEYSNSMIEAAISSKPFISVNVTGRRNLFESVTRLGFPHCESVTELEHIISTINNGSFVRQYNAAINAYNKFIY